MTTIDGNVRLTRHISDLNDDGHDIIGGFTPVVGYAECNTSPATSGTPNTASGVPFDTFYDVDGSAGSLPAGLALTYAATGNFTATEDGVWVFSLGLIPVTAPGNAGYVHVNTPDYGIGPRIEIRAAANDIQLTVERTLRLRATETVQILQASAGASVTQINGYALLSIVRIAASVS